MPGGKFLSDELARLGLDFSPAVVESLRAYIAELEHWNRSMNLTSLEGAELVRRLVAQPAWIGQKLQLSGKLIDVGSGGGSPGIPLSATCSFAQVHLVEVRSKRAAFLRHTVAKLGLKEVRVDACRVADLPELAPVDWITLQAVRFTSALGAALQRFCIPTTKVVWITSGSAAPTEDAERLVVPDSTTEVWVFNLDQFCPAPS